MSDDSNRPGDEWLALQCQLRKPRAFELLVDTMHRPLWYYATRLVGDGDRSLDVLQEVWLLAFRDIEKLAQPKSLRAWLYRLTHGVSVDRLRADGARSQREAEHAQSGDDASDEEPFDAHDAAAIHKALGELELAHREVLVLHFLEEFSVAEVAAIVGCPAGTVKSRMHAAKRELKTILMRGGYGRQA